jgi:MinD-like ATPase involved in chromosome partitioning or flagellar assembly
VEATDPSRAEALVTFFRKLREQLERAPQRFHYVLIDCRPGLTTIGITAISLLADTVVLLFGLNRQSLSGVTWVRRKFASLGKLTHLVASPVPARDEFSEAVQEAESRGMKSSR